MRLLLTLVSAFCLTLVLACASPQKSSAPLQAKQPEEVAVRSESEAPQAAATTAAPTAVSAPSPEQTGSQIPSPWNGSEQAPVTAENRRVWQAAYVLAQLTPKPHGGYDQFPSWVQSGATTIDSDTALEILTAHNEADLRSGEWPNDLDTIVYNTLRNFNSYRCYKEQWSACAPQN